VAMPRGGVEWWDGMDGRMSLLPASGKEGRKEGGGQADKHARRLL